MTRFPTITAQHWLNAMRRARAETNPVRTAIRQHCNPTQSDAAKHMSNAHTSPESVTGTNRNT